MEKEGEKKDPMAAAAVVDVQKFAAKAATMGEGLCKLRPNVYFTIRINIFPLFSFFLWTVQHAVYAATNSAPLSLLSAFFMGMRRRYSFPIEVASMCRAGD